MGYVATLAALVFVVMTFRSCGTRGRLIVVGCLAGSFVIPALIPSGLGASIGFASRMLLGVSCFLYLKAERIL